VCVVCVWCVCGVCVCGVCGVCVCVVCVCVCVHCMLCDAMDTYTVANRQTVQDTRQFCQTE